MQPCDSCATALWRDAGPLLLLHTWAVQHRRVPHAYVMRWWSRDATQAHTPPHRGSRRNMCTAPRQAATVRQGMHPAALLQAQDAML